MLLESNLHRLSAETSPNSGEDQIRFFRVRAISCAVSRCIMNFCRIRDRCVAIYFVPFEAHLILLWALQLVAPSLFSEKYVRDNLLLQITLILFLQGRLALVVTCTAMILKRDRALKLKLERQERARWP